MRARVVVGVLLLVGMPCPETTEQVLERLDREWTEAQIRGDADAVGRLLTDDFVSVNPVGGVSDKQQYLADYRSGELDVRSERLDGYLIRVHGDSAVMVHSATLRAHTEAYVLTDTTAACTSGGRPEKAG